MAEINRRRRQRLSSLNKHTHRCRTRRSSNSTEKEANHVMSYFRELSLISLPEGILVRTVFGDFNNHQGVNCVFDGSSATKKKIYSDLNFNVLREEKLDDSTDLVESALEDFRRKMNLYQERVRSLMFYVPRTAENTDIWKNVDFQIETLNNLETLIIGCSIDLQQFFGKLSQPLDKLWIRGSENNDMVPNFDEIYQVQEEFSWSDGGFNNEQFRRLTAKEVHINLGELTEKDVSDFILSWQNGTLGRFITSYQFTLTDSTFDKNQLFKHLKIRGDKIPIVIKHHTSGESAVLTYTEHNLGFVVVS